MSHQFTYLNWSHTSLTFPNRGLSSCTSVTGAVSAPS